MGLPNRMSEILPPCTLFWIVCHKSEHHIRDNKVFRLEMKIRGEKKSRYIHASKFA